MLQADQQQREDARLSGEARSPQAKVPTYQDLLDEALDSTFPASDPIAASAATHVHAPHTTLRDEHDWTLKPGGAPDAEGGKSQALAMPCQGYVTEAVDLRPEAQAPVRIPAGPCAIEQGDQQAVIFWQVGRDRRWIDVPLAQFRALMAEGRIRRKEPT